MIYTSVSHTLKWFCMMQISMNAAKWKLRPTPMEAIYAHVLLLATCLHQITALALVSPHICINTGCNIFHLRYQRMFTAKWKLFASVHQHQWKLFVLMQFRLSAKLKQSQLQWYAFNTHLIGHNSSKSLAGIKRENVHALHTAISSQWIE